MKQPHLGNKISELRIAKGLTQSELAEKCHLSLRTIQRIESAEVTPRSYSIKLIFKNLDYDAYNLTDKNPYSNVTGLFNLKKNRTQKVIILLIVISAATFGFFKFRSNNKTQRVAKVNIIINKSQINIKRWMNTSQVDSVLTLYRKDACTLNSICGKIEIGKMLQSAIKNGYELIEYNTLSISIGDTIAVEKYQNLYKYKGSIRKQFGITEWRLTNGTWLIVNDVFHDE